MMLFATDSYIKRIKAEASAEAYDKAISDADTKRAIARKARADMDAERDNCTVMFNLTDPELNIVSIERVIEEGHQEKTVIGYYLKRDLTAPSHTSDGRYVEFIREWHICCSRDAHNQLIEQFMKFKEKPTTPAAKPAKSLIKG
jgi:hypothetical protein